MSFGIIKNERTNKNCIKKNMKAETKKKTREPGENVPRNVEKKL